MQGPVQLTNVYMYPCPQPAFSITNLSQACASHTGSQVHTSLLHVAAWFTLFIRQHNTHTHTQVSETELEQIARMSTEQLLDDGVTEGAGGDATRHLLGQYGPTPLRAASTAATPARTAPHGDRIQQEAQNLMRLTVCVHIAFIRVSAYACVCV
eukprot:1159002-Pelagomonas_calceolata.AAC.6